MVKETRFYDLFGVDPDVSDADLRKAYHELALQFHPDKNPSPEAAEKFKEITMAYDVLTDPDRRRIYDLLGEKGLKENATASSPEAPPDLASRGFSSFRMDDFDDFVDSVFDEFPSFASHLGNKDIKVKLSVSLEDLYIGTTMMIAVQRIVICDACNGVNSGSVRQCPTCLGSGFLVQHQGFGFGMGQQVQMATCQDCHGQASMNEFYVKGFCL